MKKEFLLLLGTALSSVAMAQQQPNIILFLVDDMGWQDTSVPFADTATPLNRIYKTPNMERLAARGVKFTNAYACPVSSPSRVSLMTGANVTQHKVSNWTLEKDKPTDAPSRVLDFGVWNYNGMSPEKSTPYAFHSKALPEILRENGYRTIIVGKAHLGALDTPAADPRGVGFDVNIAGHAAGAMGSYLGEKNYGNKTAGGYDAPWGVPSLEAYHGSDTFLTEALTLEATKQVDSAIKDAKPFFLYMSHYAVHAPFAADRRFYQNYLDAGLSKKEAEFASLVEGMDKSLGDLMKLVDDRGIAQNTIIIFMSDNGGYSVGRTAANAPLRGGKGACYEGGIREPMIVSWNGVARAGTINATPVIIEDFFPTILEMAGVKKYDTPQSIDGRSFVRTLRSGKTGDTNRPLVFHFPNNWGERYADVGVPQSAIVEGDWKLVYTYESQTTELFNLKNDLSEKTNLAGDEKYDKIRIALAHRLSDRLRSSGANMPIIRATGQQSPYPDGRVK